MQIIKSHELSSLACLINTVYQGNLSQVHHYLSKALYLLHYVSEEDVPEVEKQEVCYLLNELRENFHRIDEERKE